MWRLIPFKKLNGTIPDDILNRGLTILDTESEPIRLLFEQRRLPEEGWKSNQIARFFELLSMMDSDKDSKSAKIGDREGRVASSLVSKMATGFHHGIGSSENLVKPQPKAAGASLLYYFANKLATDAIKRFGAPNVRKALVVPLATGMTIGLALSVARDITGSNEVIYPRVDHKAPLKGIKLVGLKEKIIHGTVFGDAVKVPVKEIEKAAAKNTCAILSTTTFFVPREPDNIKEIAKIAEKKNIPHIINNAYGVQSREIMKLINSAIVAGRVDAVIQSTDKNFLTPVGGAIVASPREEFVDRVAATYAGRASAAPIVQFLAAILSLGVNGYERLRDEQETNRQLLEKSIKQVAEKYSERLLNVHNPLSVAMTVSKGNAKKIGKALFSSRVTGARALAPTDFGVCCPAYTTAYINFDACIGIRKRDIVLATNRLEGVMKKFGSGGAQGELNPESLSDSSDLKSDARTT